MIRDPCAICLKRVFSSNTVMCDSCNLWVHPKCNGITPERLRQLSEPDEPFLCSKCINFPFSLLNDDELATLLCEQHIDIEYLNTLIYNPFELDDDEYDPLYDNDPDHNYFNNVDFIHNIAPKYMTEDSFKRLISSEKVAHNDSNALSLFNFNIRGLECHLDDFTNYLDTLSYRFDIIILTETWTHDTDTDRFNGCGLVRTVCCSYPLSSYLVPYSSCTVLRNALLTYMKGLPTQRS